MCVHCEQVNELWNQFSHDHLIVLFEPRDPQTAEEQLLYDEGEWSLPCVFKYVAVDSRDGSVTVQWYYQDENLDEEEIEECPFCGRELKNINLN